MSTLKAERQVATAARPAISCLDRQALSPVRIRPRPGSRWRNLEPLKRHAWQ